MAEQLTAVAVKELLVPEGMAPRLEPLLRAFGSRPSLASLAAEAFSEKRGRALLLKHLGVQSLELFEPMHPSVVGEVVHHRGVAAVVGLHGIQSAAGAALRYLQETQKSGASHVDRISLASRGATLVIDESSRANLELVKTLKDGARAGSLLGVLDRTSTSVGARKLARWLTAPLCDPGAITARHDAVAELLERGALRESLCTTLKQVADLERLCGRLSLASGGPRDLEALGRSLGQLPALAGSLKQLSAPLLGALVGPLADASLVALADTLQRALVEAPPAVLADGGFVKKGFDVELDTLIELSSSGKDYLLKLEAREKAKTGIASLKVRFNKVFGYYLEVTKANLALVPKEWIRKQTTANGERYVTEELKTYEEKVLTADEQRIALEQRLFEQLRGLVVARASALRAAADAVATLDVLVSFARVSAERHYTRPELDESATIELEAGRHPVVEQALGSDSFIANDVRVASADAQVLIITGPNMAGKSTVMRQVAVAVVMAQAGCFVAAKRARIGLCDRVFTRVGASDNLARGQSTFMVEMTETANILHHATRRSLVVLDEIGRGTSTFDGLSIAWAVAEHLHDRVGARTLFATHYHELTDLSREKPRVKNCSIAVREQQGRIIFLRKLIDGPASRSYGIEVAKLAGLPPEVLARAKELLRNLEAGEFDEAGRPRLARRATGEKAPPTPVVDDSQLGLFGAPAKAPPPPDAQHQRVEEAAAVKLAIPAPPRAVTLRQIPGAVRRVGLTVAVALGSTLLVWALVAWAQRPLAAQRDFLARAVEVEARVAEVSLPPVAQRETRSARLRVIYRLDGRDYAASGVTLGGVRAEQLFQGAPLTVLVDPARPSLAQDAESARAGAGWVWLGFFVLGLGVVLGGLAVAVVVRRDVRRELDPLRVGALVWLTPEAPLPETKDELRFPAHYYRDDVKHEVLARVRPGRRPVRNGEKVLAAVLPSLPRWARVVDEALARDLGWYRNG